MDKMCYGNDRVLYLCYYQTEQFHYLKITKQMQNDSISILRGLIYWTRPSLSSFEARYSDAANNICYLISDANVGKPDPYC